MKEFNLEIVTIHGISDVTITEIPFCKCVKLQSNDLFNEYRLCFVYDCENDLATTDVFDNNTGVHLFEFEKELDFENEDTICIESLEELLKILLTDYN